MSGAIIFIHEDLKITEEQEEVLVGILSIISLLGSLAGGRISDSIGRKWTMALAAFIFQTGAAIMTIAPSFQVLIIGRLVVGIGIGLGVTVAPVYIVEISPTVTRGFLTSFLEIFMNLGILLGYVSNYVFSGFPVHINWRIMLAVGILPSIFIGIALFVIPESPRWLVLQNRVEEARSVLLKISDNEVEVEERFAEIQLAAGHANVEKYKEKAVWRELLRPSPSVRRMLIVGLGLQCFQQITGSDAIVYYSPEIFKEAGIKSNSKLLMATVAVGFMLTLAFLGNGQTGIALAILFVCGNMAFFSVGIGPVCWILTSEVFPLKLRAQATALGVVGNRVSSGLIAMSFLSVTGAITFAGTFLIFSGISALSVLFIYALVPETKGKSLEQIELLFQDEAGSGEMDMRNNQRFV
ncbi:probable polyol transporter 4 [Carica papaya]|uniref:probable polyol transporter 4 n=1 Tax=Carica papaya TaxID=3649 RepID=UPI000B8CD23E|nr:probable polyol transporter 4 [Carica papaya]